MNEQDNVLYFDSSGCIAVFASGRKPVRTGASVHQEPEKYRESDALEPFLRADFHFYFDGDVPPTDLYAVPWVMVIGYDSAGGRFITTADDFSFERDFPLYYLSADRRLYVVESGCSQLLNSACDWKACLRPSDAVRIFPSRAMAEAEFEIHDISELCKEA